MNEMYRMSITDLKPIYTSIIINRAIKVWLHKYKSAQPLYLNENIPDKIDKLQQRLDRASKEEFVAIYEEYGRRINGL